MSRALLDTNVLIALLDADHVQHAAARTWVRANKDRGWASCPLTQNGCLRIMSQPAYPDPLPVAAVAHRLAAATSTSRPEFWPDEISLLDGAVADPNRIHGPRQVTDIYLLALAVRHGGTLVTFGGRIPLSAVKGARSTHLEAIGS